MALEIERRFLVKELPDLTNTLTQHIKQGYLSKPGDTAVTRVRTIEVNGSKLGYLTIKTSVSTGINNEFEYSIPYEDAASLLLACGDLRISKTRHIYPFSDKLFEIDVFHDYLDGLVIVEVELENIDEVISAPHFLSTEITGVKGLSNFAMANDPYQVKSLIKKLI